MKRDAIAIQFERGIDLIHREKVLLVLWRQSPRGGRFPQYFMFKLILTKLDRLVSQNVIAGRDKVGGQIGFY